MRKRRATRTGPGLYRYNQRGLLIRGTLLFRQNTVLTSVPFHLAKYREVGWVPTYLTSWGDVGVFGASGFSGSALIASSFKRCSS